MAKNTTGLLASAAAIAFIASFSSARADAQEAEAQGNQQSEAALSPDEEDALIIVSGIRASVQQSVDDKRYSNQIIDTINAEDIGKSTDQNIAEALNRVSGISINTNDGQGTTISVRGANADQTVVTLNGTTLGSTGFSQGVDLSSYSADILSKVEVVKTPSADDEEGSLAAVVNLVTRKPLDIKDDVRSLTLQQRYNSQSGNFDHKISGTFSQKFFGDRFGIIATVYNETNSVRRDQLFFENYDVYGSNIYRDQNGQAYAAQGAIDAEALAAATHNRASAFEGVQGVDAAGPYSDIAYGIAPGTAGYQLFQNDYKQTGVDFSAQWEISDRTNLTLNSTYNVQKFSNRMDGVFVTTSRNYGHIDGTQQPNLFLPGSFLDRTTAYDYMQSGFGGTVANWGDPVTNPTANDQLLWTDPVQNWRTLDTDTNTWTQFQSRHAIGGTQASVNKFENRNLLIGAELEHEFSDRFRSKFSGSYQRSKQVPDKQIFLVANRNRVVGPWNLHHVPADYLTPAGYNCNEGQCGLIGGTSTPYLGNIVDIQPDSLDLWDNVGQTGFNPDDLASHTLAYISSGFTEVKDEQKSFSADFDWETEFAGVTSFEFGGKYTERNKFVNAQSGTPAPGQELIEATSPFTGETIFIDPNAINLISAAIFASGQTNADNFGKGIGLANDNISDGWARFDPVKALSTITTGDRDFTLDNTQTRGADFKNLAAYAKANFSYLDDRLVGDIGLRFVHTRVKTTGYAGAQFAFDQQGQGRVIDPVYLEMLRNSDQGNRCPVLSETPSPLGMGPASEFWTGAYNNDPNEGRNYNLTAFQQRNREARIDGLGTAPAVPGGVCYDPLLEQGAIPGSFLERNLIRYSDLSTEQFGTIGGVALTDRSRASVAASDSYEYSVFLPNVNLSYRANDEIILRFSAYKTMSRPPIDDLRAGFRLNEGNIFEGTSAFRPSSTLDIYGAKIDPLTANNIDVAAEWYFNRDALLSVNLFYKNIKNLVETSDSRWFVGDLRAIASDPAGASVDGLAITTASGEVINLLLESSEDISNQPDLAACFPRRLQGEATLGTATSWMYSGDARLLCNEFNVTQRVNAGKADVKGLEIQYIHNFTFLPGPLSGLGVVANYTYQDGKFKDSGYPIPGTPQHSYNLTGFWEMDGHQLRLAYSGNSDSLIQRSFGGGSLWQDGRGTLDFSGAFQVTPKFSFIFEAQNITNAPVRTYFTSRILRLPDASGNFVNYDEGSALNGAYQGRTVQEYSTGTNFRFGVRAQF